MGVLTMGTRALFEASPHKILSSEIGNGSTGIYGQLAVIKIEIYAGLRFMPTWIVQSLKIENLQSCNIADLHKNEVRLMRKQRFWFELRFTFYSF